MKISGRPNTAVSLRVAGSVVISTSLFSILRWLNPERSMTALGPGALLDSLFAIFLLALVLLVAAGLGHKFLDILDIRGVCKLEQVLFTFALGLGSLSYGLSLMALLGLYRNFHIFVFLALSAIWGWREWSSLLGSSLNRFFSRTNCFRQFSHWNKLIWITVAISFFMIFSEALIPPVDYDGLMYHLSTTRQYLEAGKIFLVPENAQSNFSFSVEMLFGIGLATGSDTFPKLLNLSFGVGWVSSVYALGRRYLGKREAWTSLVMLFGVIALPGWASIANVDLAWSFYEVMGITALLLWTVQRRRHFLLLGAILIGFAIGVKYVLALAAGLAIGVWLIGFSLRFGRKMVLHNAITFGFIALLVASPWYIKNWILGGNPIYPYLWGGIGWSPERLALARAYVSSFQPGDGVLGYILLPVTIFVQNEHFSTNVGNEIPNPLFLLACFYPLVRKKPALNQLGVMLFLRYLVWMLSTQTRFLLPLYGPLSLLGTHVLFTIADQIRSKKISRFLSFQLPIIFILPTLIVQVLNYSGSRPLGVISGFESKNDFLQRVLPNFRGHSFVDTLPEGAFVLMMWDGRGYYCQERCRPDIEQFHWVEIVGQDPNLSAVISKLKAAGFTHLFYSIGDVEFFLRHDPTGMHKQAHSFFIEQMIPACARSIYGDKFVEVYELIC